MFSATSRAPSMSWGPPDATSLSGAGATGNGPASGEDIAGWEGTAGDSASVAGAADGACGDVAATSPTPFRLATDPASGLVTGSAETPSAAVPAGTGARLPAASYSVPI